MTTYSKEQIIGILKAAPEGAQYYTDGYDVKYRKVFGGKYYGYLEEAKGWVETCDKALSQERIDKGWWLVNLASLIETIPTETPEEKEVLDCIESTGEVEWNGEGLPPVGIECECLLDCSGKWRFCKVLFSSKESVVVVKLNSGAEVAIDPFSSSFRKPETPKQREERERLEAAYDLYVHVQNTNNKSSCNFDSFGLYERSNPLYTAIVDKTNYRKEKAHGTN